MEENISEVSQSSCRDGINCSINVSLLDVKRLGEMNQCHICIGLVFFLHFCLLWGTISIDSGSTTCVTSESSETFGRSYLGTEALKSSANCQDKSFELMGLILETGRILNELTTPVGGTLFLESLG